MGCSHLPEIKYAEFSRHLHKKSIAERIPLHGTIELTFRCNLNCVHCYCPTLGPQDIERELNYQEICRIIDDMLAEGCLWWTISGGEPLIREDFQDIYIYAKKKGLLITLFTNGTLITTQVADFLDEWPPFLVEITLYGITKEVYESITGIPGSFTQCMEGIERLLARNIRLRLKTVVLTLNQHQLYDIKRYVESLGVGFRYDPMINPGLDGSSRPKNYRLTPEEVVNLDLADEKRLQNWKEVMEKYRDSPKDNHLYTCVAGLDSFHINPYGDMQLCIMVQRPVYSLRQGSFKEGWHKFLPRLRAQRPKGDYKCPGCERSSLCHQCPAWAQLENHDPETPVEYLCQIAHLRAEVFGKDSR
ncbi:MAG: hypothetical protein A3G93_01445 [Nitrospinae bacterium RIFCSPLOWO2_12_FULL_45_22]|nr:MAG: hypothetical protein A3G93_01445 [Nitrospinae bacterium RIFCSPLOWO2_12_FULL_45_22]